MITANQWYNIAKTANAGSKTGIRVELGGYYALLVVEVDFGSVVITAVESNINTNEVKVGARIRYNNGAWFADVRISKAQDSSLTASLYNNSGWSTVAISTSTPGTTVCLINDIMSQIPTGTGESLFEIINVGTPEEPQYAVAPKAYNGQQPGIVSKTFITFGGFGNQDPEEIAKYTLERLNDVQLTTPAGGDVLTYDETKKLWVNQPAQAGLDEEALALYLYQNNYAKHDDVKDAINTALNYLGLTLKSYTQGEETRHYLESTYDFVTLGAISFGGFGQSSGGGGGGLTSFDIVFNGKTYSSVGSTVTIDGKYATEAWVTQQGFITSIPDNYITITGNHNIKGINTFEKGLIVGNTAITEKEKENTKYVEIDGNLVVTGSISFGGFGQSSGSGEGGLTQVTVKLGEKEYASDGGVVTLPAYPIIPSNISSFANDAEYATLTQVDTKIAELVNAAPETLDTLGEIASQIQANIGVLDVLTQSITVNAGNISTLQGYFTDGAANNALMLGGQNIEYFATAAGLTATNVSLENHISAYNTFKSNTEDRLSALESLWTLDEEHDAVRTTLNLIVEKAISFGGFGQGTGGGGGLSQVTVKLGTTEYTSVGGVVSLPAYPSALSQLSNDAGYITNYVSGNFTVVGDGIFKSSVKIEHSVPLYFYGTGYGTYNCASIGVDVNGFIIERARTEDSKTANIIPLIISQRGGGVAAKFEGNDLTVTGSINAASIYANNKAVLTATDAEYTYLAKSGGTITSYFGGLNIKRNDAWASGIRFENTNGVLGYIGIDDDYKAKIWDSEAKNGKVILHSGNYTDYTISLNGGVITSQNIAPFAINREEAESAAVIAYKIQNKTVGYLGFNDTTGPKWWDTSYIPYVLIHSDNINTYSPIYGSNASFGPVFNINRNGVTGALYDTNKVGLEIETFATLARIRLYKPTGGSSGANHLVLTGIGNVLVGTADDNGYSFQVNGGATFASDVNIYDINGVKTRLTQYTYDNIGRIYVYNETAAAYSDFRIGRDTDEAIVVKNNANILIGTSIDNGSKVQIHNTSKSQSLRINSTVSEYGYAYNAIGIYHNDIIKLGFGWNSEGKSVSNVGAYFKNYVSGDTISLYNEGGVLISTTNLDVTGEISVPVVKLSHTIPIRFTATGTGTYNIATIESSSSGFIIERARKTDSGNGTIIPFIISQRGGGEALKLDGNNLIVAGAITFGSDARYKTKLSDATISLEDIASAPLFNYVWTDREDKKIHLGTTAQYWNNTTFRNAVAPTNDEKLWTVSYSEIAMGNSIILARELIPIKKKVSEIDKIKEQLQQTQSELQLAQGEIKSLKQQLNTYRRAS